MANESFEIGNDYQGQADGWTVGLRSAQVGIATFGYETGGSSESWEQAESFETKWYHPRVVHFAPDTTNVVTSTITTPGDPTEITALTNELIEDYNAHRLLLGPHSSPDISNAVYLAEIPEILSVVASALATLRDAFNVHILFYTTAVHGKWDNQNTTTTTGTPTSWAEADTLATELKADLNAHFLEVYYGDHTGSALFEFADSDIEVATFVGDLDVESFERDWAIFDMLGEEYIWMVTVDGLGGSWPVGHIQFISVFEYIGSELGISESFDKGWILPAADADSYGTGDSVSVPVADIQTLTDSAGVFLPTMTGKTIIISNMQDPDNSGIFTIEYVSATEIRYLNPDGSLETSSFTWIIGSPNDKSFARYYDGASEEWRFTSNHLAIGITETFEADWYDNDVGYDKYWNEVQSAWMFDIPGHVELGGADPIVMGYLTLGGTVTDNVLLVSPELSPYVYVEVLETIATTTDIGIEALILGSDDLSISFYFWITDGSVGAKCYDVTMTPNDAPDDTRYKNYVIMADKGAKQVVLAHRHYGTSAGRVVFRGWRKKYEDFSGDWTQVLE